MLGLLGNITLAFALIALIGGIFFGYFKSNYTLGKRFFKVHGIAVLTTLLVLYVLIFTHQFQYFYVWDHTATSMDNLYLMASLWEGQEGSFLLWITFNFIVGLFVFKKLNKQNSFGFLIFSGIQFFLLLMIIGVSIGNIRVGASPFRLLSNEFASDPIFLQNPNFIPNEGSGLNPLLQNSWMAIHPPVIFLSFAVAAIPFVLYLNGIKNNTINETIKKVLPWSLATTLLLLTGITMGAYWAYETLNFGGYWSWDPVENAIYMPWLLSVAALHLQLVAYKKQRGYKTATTISLAVFCMVLYSTFLTRSGILGDSSVHAFTDLGTSPLLTAFLLLAIGLTVLIPSLYRKNLQGLNIFDGHWNRGTFMAIAAILLVLATLQVFLTTSIPVFNSLALFIGVDLNLTAPLEPIPFYNKAQSILITLVLLVSALAIISKWNIVIKFNTKSIIALIASLLLGCGLFFFTDLNLLHATFIACLLFVVFVNGIDWYEAIRTNQSSHHLTHMGFYVLLGGIIISGTGEHSITNNSNLGEEQENLLLVRDKEAITSDKHTFLYSGKFRKTTDDELIETDHIAETSNPNIYLHLISATHSKLVEITDDHFYYKVSIFDGENGSIHYPTILKSPQGEVIVHPEITHEATHDYFMHLTNFSSLDPSTLSWNEDTSVVLKIGETVRYKDHSITFKAIENEAPANGLPISDEDLALRARLLLDDSSTVLAPKFIIKNDLAYMLPSFNTASGINIKLKDIDVDTQQYTFKIGKSGIDWLTLKVVKKPFMALIWIGCFVMFTGISLSILMKVKSRIQIHFFNRYRRDNGLSGWQIVPPKVEWTKKLRKNEIQDQ